MTNLEILIEYLKKNNKKDFSSLILDNYNTQDKKCYEHDGIMYYIYPNDVIYDILYDTLYDLYEEKFYEALENFEGNPFEFFNFHSYINKVLMPDITMENLNTINDILIDNIFILDIIEDLCICRK